MKKELTPDAYYQILVKYQVAQLLFEAIKLDIFSYLDNPVSAAKVATQTGYCEKNVELLLLALSECGYIEKTGNSYFNTSEGAAYLSKASPYYLGQTLLFRESMTSIPSIGDKVKRGAENYAGLGYDFSALAELTIPEMYATGRVDGFVTELQVLFPDTTAKLKMLDLGGGSGILAMEFAKRYANGNAFVFEHQSVANTTEKIIAKHDMQGMVSVLPGDFNTDNIGSSYDLIIASGILDFMKSDINSFMEKISMALSQNGYFLLIGRFSEAGEYPKENILNWLSGYMNGIAPPPAKSSVETALAKVNMNFIRNVQSGRFIGQLYQKEAQYE